MNDRKTDPAELASSSRRTFISGLAATAIGAAASTGVLAANASGGEKTAARGTSPAKSPLTKLNNGVEMPVFGVGTLDTVLLNLARQHRKSAAQIVLRWHIQQGLIAIPKSQHYERLLANIDIFDFALTAEEVAAIDALNRDLRGGPDPATFDVAAFRAIVERRKAGI